MYRFSSASAATSSVRRRSVVMCASLSRRRAQHHWHAPAAVATAPAACAGMLGKCRRGACGHRASAPCAHAPGVARRSARTPAPAPVARHRPVHAVRRQRPMVGSAGHLLGFGLTTSSESLLPRFAATVDFVRRRGLQSRCKTRRPRRRSLKGRRSGNGAVIVPGDTRMLTSGEDGGATRRTAGRNLAGSAPWRPAPARSRGSPPSRAPRCAYARSWVAKVLQATERTRHYRRSGA
jgi:hypothetical protein